MIKRLHVNQHNIKHNRRNPDALRPVFTSKTYKSNTKGNHIQILDPRTGEVLVELIYDPENPLPCGAHAWVETEIEVRVYSERRQKDGGN